MTIVVYTALFGPGSPRSTPMSVSRGSARFVCFADHPLVAYAGWDVVMQPVTPDPRRTARFLKVQPSVMFPEADVTIWMDASFHVVADPSVIVAEAEKTGASIVGFAHPDRSRMSEEADEVIRCGMAPRADVERQQQAYQADGFDTDVAPMHTLTTTGLLVRWPTVAAAGFGPLWRHQIEQYTVRDQLSVDYCAWKLHVSIGHLPGHYRANAFVRYDRSRRVPRVAA